MIACLQVVAKKGKMSSDIVHTQYNSSRLAATVVHGMNAIITREEVGHGCSEYVLGNIR